MGYLVVGFGGLATGAFLGLVLAAALRSGADADRRWREAEARRLLADWLGWYDSGTGNWVDAPSERTRSAFILWSQE